MGLSSFTVLVQQVKDLVVSQSMAFAFRAVAINPQMQSKELSLQIKQTKLRQHKHNKSIRLVTGTL